MGFIRDARPWIKRAFEENFAIVSFNVCSLEMVRACVRAAELENAPVMLQTSPIELDFGTPSVWASVVRAVAEDSFVPVMLHLDHGASLEMVSLAIRAGYSSVMFDGEALSIEENVSTSHTVATVGHAAGACVEAAAGSFGGGEGAAENQAVLTQPEDAERLWNEANVDMVACSVGSRHGESSRLDLPMLEQIYRHNKKPIVIHGGSGVDASDLKEAVSLGVVKLNIGMALIRGMLSAWRTKSQDAQMHVEVYESAINTLTDIARDKLKLTQSSGRIE